MSKKQTWDLSDLFKSIDDPAIEKLHKSTLDRAKKFNKKYQGKIDGKDLAVQLILRAIKEYESILNDAIKPEIYASLIFSTDTGNHKTGAFLSKAKHMTVEIMQEAVFFELALSKLPENALKHFLTDKQLRPYKHFLEKIYDFRPHRLSEKEEKIIQLKALTGRNAFERFFDQEISAQKYELKLNGRKNILTQTEILNILYTEISQQKREEAAKVFTKSLIEKEDLFVYITNILAADKKIDDDLRKFAFPEQSRHLSNEISPKAVQAMVSAVVDDYASVQRYYRFKKKVLGLDKFYDHDRYAPLSSKSKKYTWDEAKSIILESFEKFSPSFAKMAKEFFDNRYIDLMPKHGKQGGAYCMYAAPDMHPYVFLNFNGSVNDVLTLAHELGHAIHGQLARKQTFLNYEWPLTMAETASIFAETIVFDHLKDAITDSEELLSLYMQKMESIIAAVHRQISMYRFEQGVHASHRKEGELSKEKINKIWKNSQKEMFGSSITLTPEYDSWWQYIPHFIHTPFYVYAYAFGELLALSLVELYKTDKGGFVEKYETLLGAGGSQAPQHLVEIFGVKLDDKKFWQKGLGLINEYEKKARDIYGMM